MWQTDRRGGAESILWLNAKIFNIEQQNYQSEISSNPPPTLFTDLGKAAPCSGIIIDHQSFARSLLGFVGKSSQTHGKKLYGADTLKKKVIRKTWQADNRLPGKSLEVLEKIAQIQKWQPFTEVALLVTPHMLAKASDKQIAAVLSGFDYLVLDLRDKHTWRNKNVAPTFLPYLVPMIQYESESSSGGKKLAQQFRQLTKDGFINHAYSNDHFLDTSPLPSTIREAISTSTYPVRPR